jgi:hypothetical protein
MYSVYVLTRCPACGAKKGRSGKLTSYQLEQLRLMPFVLAAQCASCREWGLDFEIKRARVITERAKKQTINKVWLLNPPDADGKMPTFAGVDEC